jgi:hypothetical protein
MKTSHFEFALGETLAYKRGKVTVFGRERDEAGQVVYYWVYDGRVRFKALPNELQKI